MDIETEAKINELHDMLEPRDGFTPGDLCQRKSSCVAQGNCQRALVIFQELQNRVKGLVNDLALTIDQNPSCGNEQYDSVMEAVGQIYPDIVS